MSRYRMTFGRDDISESDKIEFDSPSDEEAITKFNEEKVKQGHEWDTLKILDRIDKPTIREITTRITSE